jgi:hypothetical protein
MIKPGSTLDKEYNHLVVLRTFQEMYGLALMAGSQNEAVITDIWK